MGCAGKARGGRRLHPATTSNAVSASQGRALGVCSDLTQKVKADVFEKLKIHTHFQLGDSGQLPFSGSIPDTAHGVVAVREEQGVELGGHLCGRCALAVQPIQQGRQCVIVTTQACRGR